ncbi:hypothetical protein A1Q1_07829 [Trichosporon asahii var. asahii CBS 2479]|uniref:Uncharacterized protein n=1 Tax=Trichosporon asahii var. asahii (strain ATCC 90039 / CBS 2479 / JCM 2466 / KCTC 7840 / NBRC 103889/ NCYC 2677 / UAMH 7654) TaxID=1186058 RepID=J5R6K7_TRIAS|nr:hypothetical protein A1Q1_07829 [Trichosporon asahii var. asahii CBS 2479]EJT50963.1 hypothetical protein A1Q1_07829 [Trichosporon asahii var. asahii CBS 2479]
MAATTKLVLQPHLRERLEAVSPLLEEGLRKEVEAVLAQPEVEASRASAGSLVEEGSAAIAPANEKESHSSVTEVNEARTVDDSATSPGETEKAEKTENATEAGAADEMVEEEPEIIPPTVDVDLLDRLSRWTSGREASLRKAGLAYVAATTGAGWSRESAVLLAVAVGAIVGVADAGIVFLYKRRVKEDGVRSAKLRAKYSRGTGATGVLLERDGEGEITKEIEVVAGEATMIPAPKREVRLRRRAVGEKA